MTWQRLFENPRAPLSVWIEQTKPKEYPNEFLKLLVTEIAKRVGFTHGKVTIQFRKKLPAGWGSHIMEGDRHVIRIEQGSWSLQVETLSHELRHAQQHASGRLRWASGGNLWEGRFYPESLPHKQRPWEVDAHAFDDVGPQAFSELKARGLVPESASERVEKDKKRMGFDTRLVSEMTPEEIEEYIAQRRARQ